MYKLGAVIILIFAAFFFGRSTGIDKVTVKCQEKEIKQAQEVNNVQQSDRKNKERVEAETNNMADSAIDADLRRLGIMRPDKHY